MLFFRLSVDVFAAATIALMACGTSGQGTTQTVAPADAADGGLCARWPKAAESYDASAKTGCTPRATVLVNGENACDGATQYALVCTGPGTEGLADPALGCKNLLIPGAAEYCCPCRD
jgi:hypothetical protein